MTKALVLSGGGAVGIAWEIGVAAGLARGGVDLREADFITGTSAGSAVGARLALTATWRRKRHSLGKRRAGRLPRREPATLSRCRAMSGWRN
jgi:predicted acylesterase/phospholipase RssA